MATMSRRSRMEPLNPAASSCRHEGTGQDATKADVAELTDRLRRIENLLSARPMTGTQFTCTRSRSADDQPVITSMITCLVSPETSHPRNGLCSRAKPMQQSKIRVICDLLLWTQAAHPQIPADERQGPEFIFCTRKTVQARRRRAKRAVRPREMPSPTAISPA